MIDHALFCSKITTSDAHHFLNVQLKFLCIKTLTPQSVYRISLEWLASLQFVGATGVH